VRFCPHCSEFFPEDAKFCPDDGTELKRIHDPLLGRTIASRYRLVKRLGAGGMSSVYLAHHVMIERVSAIKILRDDFSRNPTHRERFLREARAVNRINHPNIVEISDLGESDGVAYLVMEYVDGPSLHQEIGKGRLPWQRAVRIGLQIAAALARAHQMGVVHRDLKPENILLAKASMAAGFRPALRASGDAEGEFDVVKLTDFGIAKILDEPALTLGEQLFGTPGYIAPEYLQGATADPRSDLYALGVILYETTTGALPYDDQGAMLLTAPLRGAPIPPSRRLAGYQPALETLILHLLARDPAQRPPDAFAVYDALVLLSRTATTEAATPSPSARISFASQEGVREDAKTMVEIAMPATTPSAPIPARVTADIMSAPPAGTTRWHDAILEVERALASARRNGVRASSIELALELTTLARANLTTLDRVSRAVVVQQQRVDALEAEGRSFRADIGRALDELVLDRSRERAICDAASQRLAQMGDPVPAERLSDAELWETAALTVESGSSEVMEEDLSFQIEALQRRLHERNEAIEREIVEASGALEGSLTAMRHLACELERTLREAGEELGDPELARTASGSRPAYGRSRREP
jgi:serine/threonine-protein kinase